MNAALVGWKERVEPKIGSLNADAALLLRLFDPPALGFDLSLLRWRKARRLPCLFHGCFRTIGEKIVGTGATRLLQKTLAFPCDWSVTESAGRQCSASISPRGHGASGSAAKGAAGPELGDTRA